MRLFLIAAMDMRSGYRLFLDDRRLKWRHAPSTPEGQKLVEFAGRVCYMSFGQLQSPKTNAKYVAHLISQGHESVLEHAVYSILADGISRALSHQLVRHRAGFSYSQLSQQYHDETNAEFVEPIGVSHSSDTHTIWRKAVASARSTYTTLVAEASRSNYASHLSRKERLRAIRSLARSVLPNATSTVLVMTGNARAWRRLLKVRGSISGDPEMRTFCAQLLKLLRKETPDLFSDFAMERDRFGPFVRNLT